MRYRFGVTPARHAMTSHGLRYPGRAKSHREVGNHWSDPRASAGVTRTGATAACRRAGRGELSPDESVMNRQQTIGEAS
jgi:hypothetical protein